MNMAIVCAHYGADSLSQAVLSWGSDVPLFIVDGSKGMLPAYEQGYLNTPDYDVLAYFHDDLILMPPSGPINYQRWWTRVLSQFLDDPKLGVVGFGGAQGHGSPGLYRDPYEYHQLARQRFMSNMVDAEAHGTRFTGERDVAVLDGFALIVRRELLDRTGGWPMGTPIGYLMYDAWICLMARRLGYKVRLVGFPVQHLGGRTYVKMKVGEQEGHWERYLDAHRYIYDEFKDLGRFEVKG